MAVKFWRCHFTHGTQPLRRESGEIAQLNMAGYLYDTKDAAGKVIAVRLRESRTIHTPLPPEARFAVDFDDSSWQRCALPVCSRGGDGKWYQTIPLLCLRGRFLADDPHQVGDLRLRVRYRGGVALFFNGAEIGRAHLPQGRLEPLTPAEDYPAEAFVSADGKPIMHVGNGSPGDNSRVREAAFTIPAALVRAGVNVVALEIHGAPLPESVLKLHIEKRGNTTAAGLADNLERKYFWPLCSVEDVLLEAASGAGLRDASSRSAGIRVWNRPVTDFVSAADGGDPGEPPPVISIVCPRRGSCAGQVVIGAPGPLRGLQATVSALTGSGGAALPASVVQVRWGLPDGYRNRRETVPYFDGLADAPPAETPVFQEAGGTVQPVWVTVHAPADAAPGDYRGVLTLAMHGAAAVDVPLVVRVAGWQVPDRPFTTVIDIVQSPDTVAMYYDVPMWSRRHWQLIDRTFRILGQGGANALTLTLIRRTHFGNEHGMVSWIRQPDGSLTPDLSVAERYIRTAVRHLGRIPIVILYVWEVPGSTHHMGGGGTFTMDREILISVRNPHTGLLEESRGPPWGTPECIDLWRPAIDGIRDILARHGIARSLLLGVAGDRHPTETAVKTLAAAAPYAPWYVHSHGHCLTLYGQPVAYRSFVWPTGVENPDDPDWKRIFNFQRWEVAGRLTANFPRQQLNMTTSPWKYRFCAEQFVLERGTYCGEKRLTSGSQGFGRLGADFWGVLDRHPAPGYGHAATRVGDAVRFNISSRYPDAEWTNLGINYTIPAMLSPGPDGPLSTVRLEALREAAQENEARFFLEKILAQPARRAMLGETLATRCQDLLDERTRVILRNRGHQSGNQLLLDTGMLDRAARLFLAASEAAERVDGK